MTRLAPPLLALALISFGPAAFAHPGGLNSEGCHNNRKTGDYHCHRSGTRPPSAPPAQSFVGRGDGGGTSYYPNCAAARAAGVAPLLRGEPGYRPPLDRDGDGVACEPYRGRR